MGQMYGHQGAQSMMGWAPRPQMMMYGECAEGSSGAFWELNIKAICVVELQENAS